MRDVADIMGLDLGINIDTNSIILNRNVNSDSKLKENSTNQKSNLLTTTELEGKYLRFYIGDKGNYINNDEWFAYISNSEAYFNPKALFINFGDRILPDLKKYNLIFESWERTDEDNTIFIINDSKKTETLNGYTFDNRSCISQTKTGA